MNITPLFPSLMYQCDIPIPNGFLEYCLGYKREYCKTRSNKGGWQTRPDLHVDEEFRNKYFIEYFMKPYRGELKKLSFGDIDVVTCWINVLDSVNSYNEKHIHPGCDYSFIWYINVDVEDDGGNLVLDSPNQSRDSHLLHDIDPRIVKTFNFCDNFEIRPYNGLCLTFPAYIQHQVKPPTKNYQRVSIAGNIKLYDDNAQILRLSVNDK